MGALLFLIQVVGKENSGAIGGFGEVLYVMSEGNVVNHTEAPLVGLRNGGVRLTQTVVPVKMSVTIRALPSLPFPKRRGT